jgi:hypothetical protein
MRTRYVVAGALLIAGMVAVVQAQPGGGGRGGFGGPFALINNKAVQEDLKLSEDQVTKVKEWSKEFGPKMGEIMKDKGVEFTKGGKGGFTPEMREKMAEANAEISKQAYKALGDILEKKQVDRLKQIDRQQMGVHAFANAEVAEALKLSDSQKTKTKEIAADFDKESREIRTEAFKDKKGGKGMLDPETQKKLDKLGKEAAAKAIDALDDTQKKTWKELIGAEFDLSKLQPMIPKKKD